MLRYTFWIAFLCTIVGPAYFPKWHLFYLAPYLVVATYKFGRYSLLWRALLCGVFLDTLSGGPHFGVTSLELSMGCFVLYSLKRHFFEDKLSTLPLMTFLFSFITTSASVLLRCIFGHLFPLSGQWLITDLFLMPCADALYTLLVFSFPVQLHYSLRKLRMKRRSS